MNRAAERLSFAGKPNLLNQYRRALLAKGQKGVPTSLPEVIAQFSAIRAEAKKVAEYSRVCGFKDSKDVLPITYPHILAFPLHMELMLHPEFPLALMGLVHIRNKITQHRAIGLKEKLDIYCSFSALTPTEQGLEFNIHTEVRVDDQIVWESDSTNLARKLGALPRTAKAKEEQERFCASETWKLATDLGRRYAKVSGDSNPIHLFALTAKLFGFKQHIAHGMWSKARAAATLYPLLGSDKCEIGVEFKQPVFLPASANLYWNPLNEQSPNGSSFELWNSQNDRVHVKGYIRSL